MLRFYIVMGTFYKFSCGRMRAMCATKYTHELIRKLADPSWISMQESVNILCLFFPSKFLPVLTELSTVWPRLMIPVSTCNATSTYTCEIPLSFCRNSSRTGPGAVPYGSGSSSHLAQAVVVLLTCPACLTFPGLLVPVGDELDPPALLAIHVLPRDLLL